MRKATLTRKTSTDEGTFGQIITDTGFKATIGELPWRDNLPDISCFLAGVYQVKKAWSEKHQALLWHVLEVQGHTCIEIHSGNLCGDVALGYASDVLGCMIPGEQVALFREGEKVGAHLLRKDQHGVTNSRTTLAALMADLGDEFELTIVGLQEVI